MNTLFLQRLLAPLRVGLEGVAAVDDHLSRFEQRDELLDHCIHRRAGFDHDLRATRLLERTNEILERLRENEVSALPSTALEVSTTLVVRLKTAT